MATQVASPVPSKVSSKSEQPEKSNTPWIANGVFVVFTHIVALTAFLHPPSYKSIIFLTVVWFFTVLGITAGYHRLWSHRAFTASLPLRLFLALVGTNGFQGSIKWWVLRHRLHHRFTDTEDDPYSSKKGFLFSHIGWIFAKPMYTKMHLIDASDLTADPIVVFQHKYYLPLALSIGFVLPTAVCSLWGDALGGLLWGGFFMRIMVWHQTFCINSVAHWLGDRVYSTQISARGNLICAILTNGEGYHNFHHAFPKDFRNGINWYDWDPTKWAISVWALMGQATDLFVSSNNEIEKAKLAVEEQTIIDKKKTLKYGPDVASLPTMTMSELKQQRDGRAWMIIDGCVLDLQEFMPSHPGGEKILKAYFGKDATKAFNGGLNMHTEAAKNLSHMYRIARVVPEPGAELAESTDTAL